MVSLTTTTQLFQGDDETQERENKSVSVCACLCQAVTIRKIMYAAFVADTKLTSAEKEVAYTSCECVHVCRLHLEVIM